MITPQLIAFLKQAVQDEQQSLKGLRKDILELRGELYVYGRCGINIELHLLEKRFEKRTMRREKRQLKKVFLIL